ncbi:MAG: polysaccharide deacetylase family protein [Desulfobacteraceae bacterium]|nr:polysaccharide deacetylase family protein [Desulfobacteraceae bacterium]
MRKRYSVILIADSKFENNYLNFHSAKVHFLPGTRLKNYRELLNGFGIPFKIIDIKTLNPRNLVQKNEIKCSSVVFTCPVKNICSDHLTWLAEYSFDYGISLIADSFLFSGNLFGYPFGIEKCSGISSGCQIIKGNVLYKIRKHPYSNKGFDIGIRPILRFIMQSWFSKKVAFRKDASVSAQFNNGKPAVLSYLFGKGINYFMNFHPSPVLKDGNLIHLFIRDILESNPYFPSASIDSAALACLRMDDPGSCERVHLTGYNPGVVSRNEWENILEILKAEKAHLNIAYVPQWVDDGAPEKGSLIYQGDFVEQRVPGKHYNSWEIVYSKPGSDKSHDYASEYQVIKKGVEHGYITVLSHGLTHLSVNVREWLKAENRYTEAEWFREFREVVAGNRTDRNILVGRMKKSSELIRQAFGKLPEIIVPPAHEHTSETSVLARESGFKIFSSKAFVLLRKDKIVSNRKIFTFYAEEIAEGITFSRAGYPVIFVFHDYDICQNRSDWLRKQISLLRKKGIKEFISLEALGSLLMAKPDVVLDKQKLCITIDFTDSVITENLSGWIPVKVRGIVSELKVNDREEIINRKSDGAFTFLQIPFSMVKQGKLRLEMRLH